MHIAMFTYIGGYLNSWFKSWKSSTVHGKIEARGSSSLAWPHEALTSNSQSIFAISAVELEYTCRLLHIFKH